MAAVVGKGRKGVSEYAPKIEQLQIPVDKIGEVIGPGGRVIKNIIAQTGAAIDVEDSGIVTISGTDINAVAKALDWVKGITREVKVGEIFEEAEVKRILPFGAFVEFLPGKEGMVHVSKMKEGFVNNPSDVVQIGKKVKVKVIEIDEQGRTNLSMLFGEKGGNKPTREGPQGIDQGQGAIPSPTPAAAAPSEHPLSRQFRRERFGSPQNRSQGNWRDRGSRSTGGFGSRPPGRFKKPHY
jgi:polyribonucleotide nucleotidyltransferase